MTKTEALKIKDKTKGADFIKTASKDELLILDELRRTLNNIQNESEAKGITGKTQTMAYFEGLAFALQTITGNEYCWSNGLDGNTWRLVIISAKTGAELYIPGITQ